LQSPLYPVANAWPNASCLTGGNSEYLQAQVNSASFYSNIPALNKFGWYPVACTSAYPYVCEVPFSALGCKAPPPVPPPYPPTELCLPPDNDTVLCPPGGESCYFWYSRSRTFSDAKAACKTNPGAFLISYNTAQEQVMMDAEHAGSHGSTLCCKPGVS
jgi:hypothetical protein